jgi:hypothetical protein
MDRSVVVARHHRAAKHLESPPGRASILYRHFRGFPTLHQVVAPVVYRVTGSGIIGLTALSGTPSVQHSGHGVIEEVTMVVGKSVLTGRLIRCAVMIVVLAALTARLASAQEEGGLVGQVTDESGAVLPGVAVTVTGPALQVPSVVGVTDAHGAYRVTALPIGTYTVEYALSGFQTVRREGIRLTVGFTATVDVALKVGSLAETITVSGASPVVDVKSTTTTTQLTRETIELLPSARNGIVSLLAQAPASAHCGKTAARLDSELRDQAHGAWRCRSIASASLCTAGAGQPVPWRSRKPTRRRRGIREGAASSSRSWRHGRLRIHREGSDGGDGGRPFDPSEACIWPTTPW